MKFSIVTISFNQAKFLESTIRSVVEQDYPNLEYIVVDPGSTDGSREIIERYRSRISKVVLQPDCGAADGLNHGFAEATGDIYGFLNSDDMLLPGALTKVAQAFAGQANLDIVTGHAQVIDAEGRWLRNSYSDPFHERAFAYEACNICQLSTFFRAPLLREAGGFNAANRIAWDAELFMQLFQRARHATVIEAYLSAFRVHQDAITGGATMHRALRDFQDEQFARVIGRPRQPSDKWVRLAYLIRKYALQPRSIWQRLRHGSIYGRFSTKRLRR